MIVKLPKWILVNKFPALYDAESLTAIEQTARLYGKMNELIESYNKYVDDINKTIEEFMTASDKDRETFEVAMRQEFQDFINVIDLKVMELEKYCKDNLTDTVNGLWREMEQQGQVQDLINNTLAEIITTVDEFKALMSKEQSDFETEITTLFNTFKQEVTGGQTEFETQQTQRQESFETQQAQRQESFETQQAQRQEQFEGSVQAIVGTFNDRVTTLESGSEATKDYIVEQGEVTKTISSGYIGGSITWFYRKWNSGIVECWGTTAEFTSIQFCNNPIQLPFEFIEAPKNVSYNILKNDFETQDGNSNKYRVVTLYTTKTVINTYIGCETTGENISLNISIIGKWK